MKKTITVNLGGRAFQITEDAYAQLNDYLSSIADCFKRHEGGEEITADIESRISELCEERLQHNSIKIIDHELVNDMIKRMGNPENMFAASEDEVESMEHEGVADSEEEKNCEADTATGKQNSDWRFYRNVDDKIIAGVISGVAAYIDNKHPNSNLDTSVLRIIAAVLCVAIPPIMIISYLIVWCIAPAADNTADKLRMEGIKPTPENIASKITDENYKDMKNCEKNKETGTGKIIIPILVVVAVIACFKTSPVFFFNITSDDRAMILLATIIMIPILYIAYNILNIIKKFSSGKAVFIMFLLAIFLFLLMFLSLQMAESFV